MRFSLRRRPVEAGASLAHSGRIWCPAGRDVDIDQCRACPRLAAIAERDGHVLVTCRAEPAMIMDADPLPTFR